MIETNEQKEKKFSFRLEKSMLEEMNKLKAINWAAVLRNHIQEVLVDQHRAK